MFEVSCLASFGVPAVDSPTILLHFDSSPIIDVTGRHPSITNNGPVTIDTGQSKFGGASGLFNFTNLQLDGSSDFALGLGDLTVDSWVRSTNISAGTNPIVTTHSADVFWYMNASSTGQLQLVLNGSTRLRSAVGAMVNSTWYHVAWTRAGGISRLYLDGVIQTADPTNGAAYVDANNYNIRAAQPRIGQDTNLIAGWIGNI